ncbi:MAG: hypothetical protein DWQ08_05855 [Proteobacteria bacterium]|nr:MAG: hypothetical protein DWQ08_05855 [Pseudomonadota bacterium]
MIVVPLSMALPERQRGIVDNAFRVYQSAVGKDVIRMPRYRVRDHRRGADGNDGDWNEDTRTLRKGSNPRAGVDFSPVPKSCCRD